jgi:hypothetical protein
MDVTPHADVIAAQSVTRLVVADWTVDPQAVVTWCRTHDHRRPSTLRIVVPAWLHGLDWVGDPWASVPCAQGQLERTSGLCAAAGLRVGSAAVGDPDPLSAIDDAVHAGRVDEILLFARGRHVAAGYPLSVAWRAGRLSDVPVQSIATPRAASRRRRLVLAGGHCDASLAQATIAPT